jgi:hypothetical protein
MNEINIDGYSGTVNLSTGYSGNITGNHSGTINGRTGTFTSPGVNIYDSSSNFSLTTAITNSNNMVRQVRVAVFTVKRNKENKIVSAEFTKELWVEIKNGSSVELAVAKELDKDFDPANTVIKEMYSISF